jgi:hypothetical protein
MWRLSALHLQKKIHLIPRMKSKEELRTGDHGGQFWEATSANAATGILLIQILRRMFSDMWEHFFMPESEPSVIDKVWKAEEVLSWMRIIAN